MTFSPNPPRPPGWQVALILAIGILAASTAAILVRLALSYTTDSSIGFSLVLAAARLVLAALFLVPAWPNVHRTFRQSPIRPQTIAYSLGAGVFLALHFAAWISSLSYTSIAASTALVTTNPVWVALISWVWFREKPSGATSLGIMIALAGSGLVAIGDAGSSLVAANPLLGNGLALVGSWAVSFYFLLGREAQRRGLTIQQHIVMTYTTAAIVLLPVPLLVGSSYVGYPAPVYLCVVLMALFPQLIGHTSFNWAVRWVSPTIVTLVILAEPVGSSILGFFVFQENPGLLVIAGALIVLAGVAVAAVGAREAK